MGRRIVENLSSRSRLFASIVSAAQAPGSEAASVARPVWVPSALPRTSKAVRRLSLLGVAFTTCCGHMTAVR